MSAFPKDEIPSERLPMFSDEQLEYIDSVFVDVVGALEENDLNKEDLLAAAMKDFETTCQTLDSYSATAVIYPTQYVVGLSILYAYLNNFQVDIGDVVRTKMPKVVDAVTASILRGKGECLDEDLMEIFPYLKELLDLIDKQRPVRRQLKRFETERKHVQENLDRMFTGFLPMKKLN